MNSKHPAILRNTRFIKLPLLLLLLCSLSATVIPFQLSEASPTQKSSINSLATIPDKSSKPFRIRVTDEIIEVKQDGTGDYTTIQEAIPAAGPNDTVLAYPGVYQENIDFLGKNIIVAYEYEFSRGYF